MVLDFFGIDKAKDEYLQKNFPPDFSEEKLLQEMGINDPSTKEGLLVAVPKDENQTKLLIIMLFQHFYQDHGKDVVAVMESASSYLASPDQKIVSPTRGSIVDAVKFGKLEYDEIGNPTIHVTLSSDIVDRLVAETQESVVNMSFELGDFSLTYFLYDRKPKYPDIGRQGPTTITVGDQKLYKDYEGNVITKEQYEEF